MRRRELAVAVGVNERIARLGVSRGYCTQGQMEDALKALRVAQSVGSKAQLADVLLEKRYVTSGQLRELRRSLAREGARRVIAGYELLDRVGQGGMGSVYRARQQSLSRIVALKVLAPALSADRTFVERFHREARLAARLNHPNLVQVFNVGEDKGRHYIAMEFVEGPSVDRLIELYGGIAEEEVVDIAIGVTCALSVAASQGIVHRDVKPSNILLSDQGMVKLTDLGLAKRVAGDDLHITQTGAAVGTPNYMSPEQARGSRDMDARTDIYALGASMYHMLTGRPPFRGKTPFETLRMHVDAPVTPPSAVNPRVSALVSALVTRMLAKDPDDRVQSPEALARELETVRRELRRSRMETPAETEVEAEDVAEIEDGEPPRRRGWLWAVWALATLTLLASGAALALRDRAPGPPFGPAGVALRPRPASALPASVTQGAKVEWLGAWGEKGAEAGRFREPSAVAVGREGRIYVADRWNHRVQYFDPAGEFIGQWGGAGRGPARIFAPDAIATGRDGGVWVADAGRARIIRFTPEGRFLSAWGRRGTAPGEFMKPSGLAVSRAGLVFGADAENGRVQVFHKDGRPVGSGLSGDRFRSPRGVAVDSRGNVYIADTGRGVLIRGKWESETIHFKTIDVGPMARPVGVCCDAQDRVYVTDARNHRVCVVVDGKLRAAWGEAGEGKGEFCRPEGVAAAPDGTVYIADTGNDRIVRLRFVF